jgi:hypothetical protein
MFSTIADVKAAAKKVWPSATQVVVHLADSTTESSDRYRISALSEHNLLLGRMAAKSLDELRRRLEANVREPAPK